MEKFINDIFLSQIMKYQKIFGVKVDVRISQKDKEFLYQIWQQLTKGDERIVLSEPNLMSRYEHFLAGSGYVLPPDPFKVIAVYGKNADLAEIIRERRRLYQPGKQFELRPELIANFQRITDLNPYEYWIIAEFPDINQDGRIHTSKIVGISNADTSERVELSDKVLKQLQLPKTNVFVLETGTKLREVFDYDDGYRLELVSR